MLVALDTEGKRVFADFTEKTTECFCPVHELTFCILFPICTRCSFLHTFCSSRTLYHSS